MQTGVRCLTAMLLLAILSGPAAAWYPGSVQVEMGTATSCEDCSHAASGIEANKLWFDANELHAIRYYDSSGGLSAPASDERNEYYGLNRLPSTWWNGTTTLIGTGTEFVDGTLYRAIIEEDLAKPSHFKITVNSVSLEPPIGQIDVDIEVMETIADVSQIVVRMALTESQLFDAGEEHQDVLRHMTADVPLSVSQLGQIQNVQATFPIQLNWVAENLSVVTFIQDDDDHRVLASVSSKPSPNYALRYYALGERIAVGPPNGTCTFENFRIYNAGNLTDTYTVVVSLTGNGQPAWSASLCDEYLCYGPVYSEQLAPGQFKDLHLEIIPYGSGYGTARVRMTQSHSPYEFDRTLVYSYLTEDLPILLVDDDGGESYEDYFLDALAENLLDFAVCPRTAGPVPGSVLDSFEIVIWSTGSHLPSLEVEDRTALGPYLNNGGRLFLTGQKIGRELFDLGGEAYAWYQANLHATFVDDVTGDFTLDGVSGDPISDGIDLIIEGGDGADNQDAPSDIEPADAAAHLIWTYDADRDGALRADNGNSRVVYLAFGFEAIDNVEDRREVMGRIVDWLHSGSADVVDRFDRPRTRLHVDPNPIRTDGVIRFELPSAGSATLRIYDTGGRLVRTLHDGNVGRGWNRLSWDGTDLAGERLPAGIYLCRLDVGVCAQIQKIILLD